MTTPGIQQVRRFRSEKEFVADAIFDIECGVPEACTIVDPLDPTRRKRLRPGTPYEDLLVPVFRAGKLVAASPPLSEIRERTQRQLAMFHPGIKRFVNPHTYPVGLELGLNEMKTQLVQRARETVNTC